jgi:hypothetical protein
MPSRSLLRSWALRSCVLRLKLKPYSGPIIVSWLEVLHEDPVQLVKAAGPASKVYERIMKMPPPEPEADDSIPTWCAPQPTQVDMWAPQALRTP